MEMRFRIGSDKRVSGDLRWRPREMVEVGLETKDDGKKAWFKFIWEDILKEWLS